MFECEDDYLLHGTQRDASPLGMAALIPNEVFFRLISIFNTWWSAVQDYRRWRLFFQILTLSGSPLSNSYRSTLLTWLSRRPVRVEENRRIEGVYPGKDLPPSEGFISP